MTDRTQNITSRPGWGIRSLATGKVYPWANSRQAAEFMWAGTGAPDRYQVVQRCDGQWVAQPSVTLPPTPAFAATPLCERLGDDEEIVRMAICLTDPLYGKKVEPLQFNAAQIRQIAEQRTSQGVSQRLRRLVRWRSAS